MDVRKSLLSHPDHTEFDSMIHIMEALWATARELCNFSRGARRDAGRPRNRLWLSLFLIFTVCVATTLAISSVNIMSVRLHLPLKLSVFLACAQTLPIPLSVVRPISAWWISIAATIGYALSSPLVPEQYAAGSPWPWTGAALIAHLVITWATAWHLALRVVVAQWGLSVLTGLVLQQWSTPPGSNHNLPFYVAASLIGLALVTAVRSNIRARQQLRKQESLTAYERSRRAVLEERARIARELHDVVAHHLSVVAVQAEAAPYRVTNPPKELTESFAGIRQNALAALTEMRHLVGELRSDEAEPDGRHVPQPGLDNLDELLGNVRSAGLHVEADVRGTPRALPRRLELSVFRIVQESLSNALRHSPGSEVAVILTYRHSEIEVRVSNGPPAGPVTPRPGSGHGVLGMRERASMLGGTLRAMQRADGGYEVTGVFPSPSGESEEA